MSARGSENIPRGSIGSEDDDQLINVDDDLLGTTEDVPLLLSGEAAEEEEEAPSFEWDTKNETLSFMYSDLDMAFRDMYTFYTYRGFQCILMSGCFSILYLFLLPTITAVSIHCIIPTNKTSKMQFELLLPGECFERMSSWTIFLLALSMLFTAYQVYAMFGRLKRMWNTRAFYRDVLGVDENALQDMNWSEIQRRIIDAQVRIRFYIPRSSISELDIHNRILRFVNYEVALINQRVIEPVFDLPLIGKISYYPVLLSMCIRYTLFHGRHGLFEQPWMLNCNVKREHNREKAAAQLAKQLLYLGSLMFALSPLILLFKMLSSFYRHTEVLRQNPSIFSKRVWTQYGRIYLRHLNELDHELNERLSEAYDPVNQLLDSFVDNRKTVILRFVGTIAGSIAAVMFAQTLMFTGVVLNEGFLFTLSTLGILHRICSSFSNFVPVVDTELAITRILRKIHYAPSLSLEGTASPAKARDEIAVLINSRVLHFVAELLSPLLCPLILIFHMRPRVLQIIDFFRKNTIEIDGIGDVCCFASMDTRAFGNAEWTNSIQGDDDFKSRDGKLEKSVVRFHTANPYCTLPPDTSRFLSFVQDKSWIANSSLRGNWNHTQMSATYANRFNVESSIYQRHCECTVNSSGTKDVGDSMVILEMVHLENTSRNEDRFPRP